MTKLTVTFAMTLALLLAQHSLAQPVAIYNIVTGNITFDGFVGVGGARLFSTGGNLIPDVGEDIGFWLTEETATLYTWLHFGGGVTGDGLVAGDIITPGTDVSDLLFDYTIGGTGHISLGEIRVVPEPTTFVLAGIGLVGFTARRRGRTFQQSLLG